MSLNNAVVWIDHTKAQVIYFDADASESESLKTHSTHPHPHKRHGDTHAAEDDNTAFFDNIAVALNDASTVLVVGPAQEKNVFVTYLKAKMPALAAKIAAVKTVDHPSDAQLLTHARKYFVSAGGLK